MAVPMMMAVIVVYLRADQGTGAGTQCTAYQRAFSASDSPADRRSAQGPADRTLLGV